MHGDAIGAYPVQLRICEPTEVPIVRGQDDGNSPEEDLICEHLRGRLSKDGSVNVRLQELLVVYDEARICHLVQQDCDVVVPPESVHVRMLCVLDIHDKRAVEAEERAGKSRLASA